MDYSVFLKNKSIRTQGTGKIVTAQDINPKLYDFQKAMVIWALRRGKAAIWADCGLGKSFCQIEWARLAGGQGIILAPLSVVAQTINEAKKLGIQIKYARTPEELGPTISITNYERIDAFKDIPFNWVVLDESSILKSFDGSTRTYLMDRFADTPYRLCCTATPAPNDFIELGNHAQFLGIMKWQEMAATYFVHDPKSDNVEGWRLKKHAEDDFWHWLVTWGIFVKKPSDIGFRDDRYHLPALTITEDIVQVEIPKELTLSGIRGRNKIRKHTQTDRIEKAAQMINGDKSQWLVWVGLNSEGQELAKRIPDAVVVEGADDPDEKASALIKFAEGGHRVLITKARIAGFGMNFQNCSKQLFLGIGDSYEQYYQCIRRSWRYGQANPVEVHIVVSQAETGIVENVKVKERQAEQMSAEMIKRMADLETVEVNAAQREEEVYKTDSYTDPDDRYTMILGDCVQSMKEILPDDFVDLSVYSPPFASLYTYTASSRDLGNSKNEQEFFDHYGYFTKEILRVTKPGRLTICHVSQIPAMLSRDGYIGLKDFRGRVIDAYKAAGWIHHGEVVIDKNPQIQAIRTKAKSLLFSQLRKDSSWLRPALADYLLIFRKDGDNQTPIKPDMTNEEWIKWAHPIWYDIKETRTLRYFKARDEKDEKHICPLQLEVIERAVRLWSNPGELVFSPFAGIGSEGFVSLQKGRRFLGIELKESYFKAACANLEAAKQPPEIVADMLLGKDKKPKAEVQPEPSATS